MIPVQFEAERETDPALSEIAAAIGAQLGATDWISRSSFLVEKVEERRRALGLSGVSAYLSQLKSQSTDGPEWSRLIDSVTVGETFFWRYPEQWDALREIILPDLAKRRGAGPVRIWCAGCSSGAEPYTLSILLHREATDLVESGRVKILATDVCATRLAQAEAGVYGQWELRGLSPTMVESCFEPENGKWRLRDAYRRGVTFRRHNLADYAEQPDAGEFGGLDIIMCRNVLIYFDAALVRRLLQRFQESLSEGGWFLSGHSEPYLEISRVLEPVTTPGATLYRKSAVHGARLKPRVETPAVKRRASTAPIQREAAKRSVVARDEVGKVVDAVRPASDDPLGELNVHLRAGAWREAASAGRRIVDSGSLDPQAHYLFALALIHSDQHSEAERVLRRALYLDTDYALAHYQLGVVALEQGRRDDAHRAFRNVVQCLRTQDDDASIRSGDGTTASELRQFARLQLAELTESQS